MAGPTTNPVTNPPGYTFTTIAGNPGVAGSSDGVGTNAPAVGAGTATVIASQQGDKNYLRAMPVTNSVMVY